MTAGSDRTPILVTGSHRSGSSFVGSMLAAAPGTALVFEPFNPNLRPGWLPRPVPHWYHYVCPDNADSYSAQVDRVLTLHYPLAAGLRGARTPKQVALTGRNWLRATHARLGGARPIAKDPLALFSAPWFADRYGASILVLVRHPAAFVSSVVRLGWGFDVRNWLEQPLLLRDVLGPYQAQLQELDRVRGDPVAEAVLLWRVLYGVVASWEGPHPDWIIRRYDDIALDPHGQFRALYDRFGLRWDDGAQAAISAHTSTDNAGEVEVADFRSLRRDSSAAARSWTRRLGGDAVARIRDLCGPEGAHYYPRDDDWWWPESVATGPAPVDAGDGPSGHEQEGPGS